MAILAEAMMEDGRLDPCLVLTDDVLVGKANAADYVRLPKVELPAPHIRVPWELPSEYQDQKPPFTKLLLRVCSKLIPEWAFEIWWQRKWYQQYYDNALKLIKQTRPLALVTIDDRLPGTIPMLKAARSMGVATLVVPVAVSAFSKSLAAIRSTQPDRNINHPHQIFLKRWVAWRYPNQVLTEGKGRYLFYTPTNTIALEACGMLPNNPFSLGGGLAQKVAVGEDDKQRLVQDGLEPSKVAVTGDPGSDRLYQAFRQKKIRKDRLIKDYRLDPTSKILLCALPQFGEHGQVSWERHWQIVRELVNALAASGQTVMISLHPKADQFNYLFLEAVSGVKIVQDPLMEILPCADIFISALSSTVRWAVLSAVPVIVMDILESNLPLFKNIKGTIHISGKNIFRKLSETLNELLTDNFSLQQLRQALAKEAPKVSPFDGRANQKIIDLVLAMSCHRQVKRTADS